MKYRYYKLNSLIAGLPLFAISMFGITFLFFKKYYLNLFSELDLILFIICFIGFFIGEGLILNAASYKVK